MLEVSQGSRSRCNVATTGSAEDDDDDDNSTRQVRHQAVSGDPCPTCLSGCTRDLRVCTFFILLLVLQTALACTSLSAVSRQASRP